MSTYFEIAITDPLGEKSVAVRTPAVERFHKIKIYGWRYVRITVVSLCFVSQSGGVVFRMPRMCNETVIGG